METTPGHRKVELQTPEDLSYLIANVRRAARERIDEAFPPVNREDGEDDELRLRIEALVEEVSLSPPSHLPNSLNQIPQSLLGPAQTRDQRREELTEAPSPSTSPKPSPSPPRT